MQKSQCKGERSSRWVTNLKNANNCYSIFATLGRLFGTWTTLYLLSALKTRRSVVSRDISFSRLRIHETCHKRLWWLRWWWWWHNGDGDDHWSGWWWSSLSAEPCQQCQEEGKRRQTKYSLAQEYLDRLDSRAPKYLARLNSLQTNKWTKNLFLYLFWLVQKCSFLFNSRL